LLHASYYSIILRPIKNFNPMNELIKYILESKSSRLDLLDWSYRNNFNELFNHDTIHLIAKLRPDIEKISIAYIYPETLRNLQYLPNLKELYLEECVVIQDDWQEIVYLTNLQSLTICGIEHINNNLFLHLAKLSNFETLSIVDCEHLLVESLTKLSCIKNLKNLSLSQITWVGSENEIFQKISEVESLHSLEILYGMKLTDENINSLLKLKTHLKRLIITGFNDLTDSGFYSICKFSHLDYLHIEQCNQFTNKSINYLTNLLNLKKLTLNFCYDLSEENLNNIGRLINLSSLTISLIRCSDYPIHKLSKLEALEHLNLHGTFKSINGIASLTNLKSLSFSEISDFEDLKNLNLLKNLKKIDIAGSNYKDEVIQVFFELRQIEELNLSRNNLFFGDKLVTFNFNSNLKKLNFNKCSNLIDVSLEAISNLKSLSDLNLSECKKITDNGIVHLAKLPLTSLNLEKCDLLTNEALKYIGKIDSLHYLNLEYCINIADEGIKHLSNLNQLEEINLRWCEGVTYQGLKHLISLPNLKIIKIRNHLKRFPWEELKNLSQGNKNIKFL